MKKPPSKTEQKSPVSKQKAVKLVPKKGPKMGGKVVTCPDDPDDLCTKFMEQSVFEWQGWIVKASSAYFSCCKKIGPGGPSIPVTDCVKVGSCHNVCKLFRAWANDIRKWAEDFTKAVDKCFGDDWHPTEKVPAEPKGRCIDCSEVCHRILEFHIALGKWAEDVRYPLNKICKEPGPERVPEPPESPFQ